MIVEYIRYQNNPAESPAFVAAYEAASNSLRSSPHCLSYELTQCNEAPGDFILRIVWDSLDGHLKGFRASAEFKTFFAAIRPYVNNIKEMRHYQVSPVAWSR